MTDIWNFKDTLLVAQSNVMWLILALVIGLIIGWVTCSQQEDTSAGDK